MKKLTDKRKIELFDEIRDLSEKSKNLERRQADVIQHLGDLTEDEGIIEEAISNVTTAICGDIPNATFDDIDEILYPSNRKKSEMIDRLQNLEDKLRENRFQIHRYRELEEELRQQKRQTNDELTAATREIRGEITNTTKESK